MPNFLRSKAAIFATAFLLVQAGLLYSSIRPEVIPQSPPLSGIPVQLSDWTMQGEFPMDPETQAVLQADDSISRLYANPAHIGASLFVAAFRSQRNGKAPHSPKNCLPGSGWVPLDSGQTTVDVGTAKPIPVNRYIIAFGENRSMVLYWYQSRDRSVASEYNAKFWVMVDAMRLNRTDTALVRVIVPIVNRDEATAEKTAKDFVRAVYQTLLQHLPS